MATSAVGELTSCVVCFEPFQGPQLLPCQHTFCKSCVDRIADAGTIRCPTCNTVSDVDDIRSDFRLAQFLDAFAKPAEDFSTASTGRDLCEVCERRARSQWCNECTQWLCDDCTRLHGKTKCTRNHTFSTLQERNDVMKAPLTELLKEIQDNSDRIQTVVEKYEAGVKDIKAKEAELLQKCQDMRQQCIAEINNRFDEPQ